MPMRVRVHARQPLEEIDSAHSIPDVQSKQLEPQVAIPQIERVAAVSRAAPPLLRAGTLTKSTPIGGQTNIPMLGKLLGIVYAGLPFLHLRIIGIVLWRQDTCGVILAASVAVGAEDARPLFTLRDVFGREQPGRDGGKGLAVVENLLPYVATLVVALDHLDVERYRIGDTARSSPAPVSTCVHARRATLRPWSAGPAAQQCFWARAISPSTGSMYGRVLTLIAMIPPAGGKEIRQSYTMPRLKQLTLSCPSFHQRALWILPVSAPRRNRPPRRCRRAR